MGDRSRNKGLRGEHELASIFTDAGWTTRGLEAGGDWLVFPALPHSAKPRALHIECKRQERIRIVEWLDQARTEAPAGIPPVVCFRQNHGQWIAALPLADLLRLIA